MQLLPALLVAVAVLVGLVILLRRVVPRSRPREADTGSPRITAELRSGEEQVLIALARSLSVSMGPDQVGYGEIYVVSSADNVIKLASRSEIGRGFDGEIRLHRGRRGTIAEYSVLRLPADESLHARVLRMDRQIVDALHAIDPQAEVRVRSEQLQPHDTDRTPPQRPAGRPQRGARSVSRAARARPPR